MRTFRDAGIKDPEEAMYERDVMMGVRHSGKPCLHKKKCPICGGHLHYKRGKKWACSKCGWYCKG